MAARAIWKGVIGLGDVAVPVKLYGAVAERRVHFRLIHQKDRTPVKQEMVHPETAEVVPAEAIRHGYETEDGRLVILTEQELQSLEPEPSRQIEIIRFLAVAAIDHQWYERPYFLGPDDDREAYFALAEALASSETVGLSRWVMRNKEYFGVLRLQAGYPVLITLRPAEEVLSLSELKIPAGRPSGQKELAMAEQLVAAMADRFEPEQYHDEYRERVAELIAAKASGKIIEMPKAPPQEAARDLQEALAASLQVARGRKSG
jgi:DNA end-binding protein Ku